MTSLPVIRMEDHVTRGLADRSYDKRKNAALEIEATIKAHNEANDTEAIRSIIRTLATDFASSTNPNHRKGGLIGLAATTIGLSGGAGGFLDDLLPPVLHWYAPTPRRRPTGREKGGRRCCAAPRPLR